MQCVQQPENAILRLLLRVADALRRYSVCIANFGLRDAWRLLFTYRSRVPPTSVSVHLRPANRRIHFRGAADAGVMSHFYQPGCRIVDSPAQPVRTIIDAGANIGDETIRFRHFHPEARIIALEPSRENFRVLEKNLGDDPNCILLNCGLWNKDCFLDITSGNTYEQFRVSEVASETPDTVRAVCLPSLMADYGLDEIDILKLDIEGAEFEVFAPDSSAWVPKVKVCVFECPDGDRPGAAMRIFQAFLADGFHCSVHGENLILIRPGVPWTVASDLFFRR